MSRCLAFRYGGTIKIENKPLRNLIKKLTSRLFNAISVYLMATAVMIARVRCQCLPRGGEFSIIKISIDLCRQITAAKVTATNVDSNVLTVMC